MTDKDFLILEDLCTMDTGRLFKFVKNYLKSYKFNAFSGGKNHYVAWGSPIALVAHLDTVFSEQPKQLFYDRKKDTILALGGGAGFDDRAGVYAILKILKETQKLSLPLPTVIITLGEEDYGIGAREAGEEYQNTVNSLNYMIELDRANKNDCVFYQCTNQKFKDYIASFGFEQQSGSYTDITFLMEYLQICGVNLSIGYYEEHTNYEYLRPSFLESTIYKVINILSDTKNAEKFEYQTQNYIQKHTCDKCHKLYSINDLVLVNTLRGEEKYCVSCVLESCNWCKNCKALIDREETDVCPVCGKDL